MRFASVPLALLVCSSVNGAPPTATTDPSANYFAIDVLARPTSVNVLNWPEVQAVSGTVSVDNFPATQTVGGSVNVGNLPLADDGSVRVSSPTTRTARPMVMYELMDGYVPFSNFVALPVGVDMTGYSSIGVFVRGPGGIQIETVWQWADGEPFADAYDHRPGSDRGNLGCLGQTNNRYVCANLGGRVGVIFHQSNAEVVTSVRVYLIP